MLDIFHFTVVLGGPISRRTAGHHVLRHLEAVRHDFSHPHSTRTHTRTRMRGLLSSVSSLFSEGAWTLTQMNDV